MTHHTTLRNGLEVTLIETAGNTVGISLVGRAGALYASPGLAHFLEHTILCATERHPDFLSLANTVDSLGLQRNASTSQETMQFVFKCLPEHMQRAFEFLSEVTTEALLLDSDIDKQRKIVTQEIGRQNGDPNAFTRLRALEGLYGGVGPGIPILGKGKDIESISRQALEAFYREAFVAENFKLVVCGTFDMIDALSRIESTLGHMPSRGQGTAKTDGPALATDRTPISPLPTKMVTKREGLTQAVLTIAWAAPANDDRLRHATQMFKVLMADGRLSRLWQVLRQKNALAYSYSCFYVRQRSFGYFYITTGLAPENVDRALTEIHREIKKLSEELISDEDLERARNIVRTSIAFESDSALGLAVYHSSRMMSDPEFTGIENELYKYETVTKEDIREAVLRFATGPAHVAVVTPELQA